MGVIIQNRRPYSAKKKKKTSRIEREVRKRLKGSFKSKGRAGKDTKSYLTGVNKKMFG